MSRNNHLPIMLGASPTPNKVAICKKTNLGHELFICGIEDGNVDKLDGRLYAEICFCNIETLKTFIGCLEEFKDKWEKEIE